MLKYVLIGRDVLFNYNLNLNEKVIFSLVTSFFKNSRLCYLTNIQMSEILGCSETTIRRTLRSLEKKQFVYCEYHKNGIKRAIYPNFEYLVECQNNPYTERVYHG